MPIDHYSARIKAEAEVFAAGMHLPGNRTTDERMANASRAVEEFRKLPGNELVEITIPTPPTPYAPTPNFLRPIARKD